MGIFGVNAYKKSNALVAEHSSKWLRSKQAVKVLAAASIAESIFAPILIDPILIAMIIASPDKWKRYVIVSVAASIIGGTVAYILGALFFDTLGTRLIAFYSLESSFSYVSDNLNNNGFVFVLIGAFTPIPYKIVALASGLLKINFLTFLVASIFGRALRLGLVGLAAHAVGPRALPLIRKHLYSIAAAVGVLLCIYIALRFIF